jgi:hypothetical protein
LLNIVLAYLEFKGGREGGGRGVGEKKKKGVRWRVRGGETWGGGG